MITRHRGWLVRSGVLLAVVAVTSAHVGSPDVFFDGMAGPYAVRVMVRPPQVVPGLAEIVVRANGVNASDVSGVVVRPVFWSTGAKGSPRGDTAQRIPAPDPTFTARLWLMRSGSWSVQVSVNGARGTGSVSVPVTAVATASLPLGRGLRVALTALGLFLVAGLVTLVHAGAGEALTAPGERLPDWRRRRARRVALGGGGVLAVLVLGGGRWWQAEADAYRRRLYRPLEVQSAVDRSGMLELAITDSIWRARQGTPLVPDHGKLAHLFLVRDGDLAGFAHLHPVMRDSNTFVTYLPPLPAGRYRLYADVVHESGLPRTLTDTVDLPGLAGDAELAADDGWSVTTGGRRSATAQLADGTVMQWLHPGRLVEGSETTIRVNVLDRNGAPASVEPYLGMAGHAVITKRDGSVFIHLHPSGTVSLASQRTFALRDRGDTTPDGRLRNSAESLDGAHTAKVNGQIGFPYAFPSAGSYRVWVQVKRSGRVLTGVYDIEVEAR